MKKGIKILGMAIFMCLSSAVTGQSLNISGGYTMSWLKMEGSAEGSSSDYYNGTNYSSSWENKNLNGYNIFVGYEFNLGKRLSLETGIKYQTRGYRGVFNYTSESEDYNYNETSTEEIKMKYFDIPIVLNTAFIVGDVNVYVRTGIFAGILSRAEFNDRAEYSSSDANNGFYESSQSFAPQIDLKDRFTGGIVLGLGVEYKGFYFESNYNYGLTSFASDGAETYSKDLSFSLGYKIKFEKK